MVLFGYGAKQLTKIDLQLCIVYKESIELNPTPYSHSLAQQEVHVNEAPFTIIILNTL